MTQTDPETTARLRAWLATQACTHPTADDLAAWAEGGLDSERAARIELALAQDATLRRAVVAWQSTQPDHKPKLAPLWVRALASWHLQWQRWGMPVAATASVVIFVVVGVQLGEGLAQEQAYLHSQRVAAWLGPLQGGARHAL